MKRNYGWKGTLVELFQLGSTRLTTQLTQFLEEYDFPVGDLQKASWTDTFDFLQSIFQPQIAHYQELYIVFEYMLPLEKGRRPDILLMLKDRVIILEFKQKGRVSLEDIEQTIGYQEDLKKFHHVTYEKGLKIKGYLVLTEAVQSFEVVRGIEILNRNNFLEKVRISGSVFQRENDVNEWVSSPYQPLPTVTKATLDLFQDGHLPHIKNIEEGAISETVKFIKKRIRANETVGKGKEIIFVSGVPGAGKTLVAIKTLYDYNAYQYKEGNQPLSAIYLSGNGPLVNVLQEQLQDVAFNESVGKTYIKGVFEFKREYLHTRIIPPFHCIFFDEAQRAWDEEKMGRYQMSEPEGLLQVGEKIFNHKGYATIVCFIGDGQTIHVGEEKGIPLWQQALMNHPGWRVYIPPNYAEQFQGTYYRECEQLFLDTSIRSNFIDTSGWIEALLKMDMETARNELVQMQEKGFILRISCDYEACKRFIENKRIDFPDMMYGMLVSSKSYENQVRRYTNNPYYKSFMKDTDAGKWFLHECKTWRQGATEFVCQGLELDFPLVCFGGDYFIHNRNWMIESSVYQRFQLRENERNDKKFSNFPVIIANIYRVLLSRSRRGMVLYIPNEPRFNETYDFFINTGADEL
ncbi:DNA/RNA helicase domain-containing protein [Neobacillus rhizosphaerae]|uniref:DNA/RNA helicase domain-containing protein n=1 Tax=Neobacillus rhizosphaerae TaxID=2880965 RepID=UPI003D276938